MVVTEDEQVHPDDGVWRKHVAALELVAVNPLRALPLNFLGRLGTVPSGPRFPEVLRRHLDTVHATDPQVVQTALGAIGDAG